MVKKIIFIFSIFVLFNSAIAGEFLNGDEIKSLVTNKSWDVHNVAKDKTFKGYDNDQGEHYIHVPWKDKTFKRRWWVEGDMHCTSHPKRGDNCKKMKKVSEGVYHGISDGEHTHTLSNFRDGRDF